MAAPIPEEAPVTSPTRPAIWLIFFTFLVLCSRPLTIRFSTRLGLPTAVTRKSARLPLTVRGETTPARALSVRRV